MTRSKYKSLNVNGKYVLALEEGFPRAHEMRSVNLFKLPVSEGGFERVNALAVEMNRIALMP